LLLTFALSNFELARLAEVANLCTGTVPNWTALLRTTVTPWGVMPKKRLKKQSYEALLSEVKKEMAQPRAAASTRSEKVTLRRRITQERVSS